MRRYKSQIKQSITGAINKRSITDMEIREPVSIPNTDINEPIFHKGLGACHLVHPGNDHFVQNGRRTATVPPSGGYRWRSRQCQPGR
ncbi:DUF444 family protein [Sodalis-like endosymbiont of Proechinophthirus fluctus]|uniref:DUF444 family protein n=1 Tax=Sodalis-like endosymbiont of Proechinophthirus fluctus TaxID=1462730 RepID=UPI00093BCDEC